MACILSLSLLCPWQTLLISYDILFYELGLGSKSIWTTVSMDRSDETSLPCILKQPKYSRGPIEPWNLNKVKLSFMKLKLSKKKENGGSWGFIASLLRFYEKTGILFLWRFWEKGRLLRRCSMSKPLFQPLCKCI